MSELTSVTAGTDLRSAPARHRSPWPLLVAVLAVVVTAIASVTVTHTIDSDGAAAALYRTQLQTAYALFYAEAARQFGLPPAERGMTAYTAIAQTIDTDGGINGGGSLQVSLGSGSITKTQVAFSFAVDSPYAASTLVLWYIYTRNGGAVGTSSGGCALRSSLAGPGLVTADLQLGGNLSLQACDPQWWQPGGNIYQPYLAGISRLSASPGLLLRAGVALALPPAPGQRYHAANYLRRQPGSAGDVPQRGVFVFALPEARRPHRRLAARQYAPARTRGPAQPVLDHPQSARGNALAVLELAQRPLGHPGRLGKCPPVPHA